MTACSERGPAAPLHKQRYLPQTAPTTRRLPWVRGRARIKPLRPRERAACRERGQGAARWRHLPARPPAPRRHRSAAAPRGLPAARGSGGVRRRGWTGGGCPPRTFSAVSWPRHGRGPEVSVTPFREPFCLCACPFPRAGVPPRTPPGAGGPPPGSSPLRLAAAGRPRQAVGQRRASSTFSTYPRAARRRLLTEVAPDPRSPPRGRAGRRRGRASAAARRWRAEPGAYRTPRPTASRLSDGRRQRIGARVPRGGGGQSPPAGQWEWRFLSSGGVGAGRWRRGPWAGPEFGKRREWLSPVKSCSAPSLSPSPLRCSLRGSGATAGAALRLSGR